MYAAKQIALADVLEREAVTAAAAVLREAMANYKEATERYYLERERGGIIRMDDVTESTLGVRYRAVTFDGGTALIAWQRARAELAAAVANRRRELGDTACRPCAGKAA